MVLVSFGFLLHFSAEIRRLHDPQRMDQHRHTHQDLGVILVTFPFGGVAAVAWSVLENITLWLHVNFVRVDTKALVPTLASVAFCLLLESTFASGTSLRRIRRRSFVQLRGEYIMTLLME